MCVTRGLLSLDLTLCLMYPLIIVTTRNTLSHFHMPPKGSDSTIGQEPMKLNLIIFQMMKMREKGTLKRYYEPLSVRATLHVGFRFSVRATLHVGFRSVANINYTWHFLRKLFTILVTMQGFWAPMSPSFTFFQCLLRCPLLRKVFMTLI